MSANPPIPLALFPDATGQTRDAQAEGEKRGESVAGARERQPARHPGPPAVKVPTLLGPRRAEQHPQRGNKSSGVHAGGD